MFIATLFLIAKRGKEPKCALTDGWINNMWYIHIREYYSAIKKELTIDVCNNIDESQKHIEKNSQVQKNA